jgi:probable F420-dependent oxidoreductase
LRERVPADDVVIGALGTRTLDLAGRRTLGAHPYLTVPAHTKHARNVMGTKAFLAPELKVVLTDDADQARSIGRPAVQHPYLGLRNYTDNLQRHGFTEDDVSGAGSDRLVDALVAWGDEDAIVARVQAHRDAGASHVCIQALEQDPRQMPAGQWRALAAALV